MKRLILLITLLALLLSLCACGAKKPSMLHEEDIRAICELATVKCYYNNVAKIEKEASFFLQRDRKMWIEYEGEAIIGVDMNKMEISVQGNTVTIRMPAAEILSIQPLESTLNEDSYICSQDGWLFKNEITTEEQMEAINQGQEEMREAVEGNRSLFLKAEAQAKTLIENYIHQLGEITGREYSINWIS